MFLKAGRMPRSQDQPAQPGRNHGKSVEWDLQGRHCLHFAGKVSPKGHDIGRPALKGNDIYRPAPYGKWDFLISFLGWISGYQALADARQIKASR